MVKKQDIRVQLSYHEKLPGFYKDMLHSICNEVIKTAPRHYTTPYIAYPGQSENERSALLEQYNSKIA
uniref:Uncharacterized protein n=1 Tax=Panagrolaimus davidi TaxID=227884 RepID=A0A914P7E9_9BILA